MSLSIKHLLSFLRDIAGIGIIAAFMLCSIDVGAQSKKVTIGPDSATVGEVLKAIESQTGYLFVYNTEDVDVSKKVSLDCKNVSVSSVLEDILAGQNLRWQLDGRYIKIMKQNRGKNSAGEGTSKDPIKVKGKVTGPDGEPLIGAGVLIKGTKTGVITDVDGTFEIEIPSNGPALLVSCLGFADKEVQTLGKQYFDIVLQEDTNTLDEIVVIGYGTSRKVDLTGSVGSVNGKTIADRKSNSVASSLQGTMAGVTVTRSSNEPSNEGGDIKVRGITTIGDSTPLVIIDGVPGDMSSVSPEDIENISVLKDAASASIYGSRAAAGVILITTKRGSGENINISYNVEYGYEIPTANVDFVDLTRYLEMTNELRYNDNPSGGLYQAYSEDQVENWLAYNKTDPDNYPNTDWRKLVLSDAALRSMHRVNISGGSKDIKTNASFTYNKTDGLYNGLDYKRYMTKVNNDINITDYLHASIDFSFNKKVADSPITDPYNLVRYLPPIYAAKWHDGRIADGKGANIYALVNYGGFNKRDIFQFSGKAQLDFKPLPSLRFSAIFAPNYVITKQKSFQKELPWTTAENPDVIGGYLIASTRLSEYRNDSKSGNIQFLANYNETFKGHTISAMAGYETNYYFYEGLTATKDKFELSDFPYMDVAPNNQVFDSGNAYETALRSFFGRVSYNYKNRYLLQANCRWDGSSRFAKKYRWGMFPSISGAWVLSEEPFFNLSKKSVSFLKLRLSYGSLGNERIGNYPYQSLISTGRGLFVNSAGEPVEEMTAAQRNYVIKDISWETTNSIDGGLDVYFLNNRLSLSADYYNKKTKNMLLSVEIPDYVGYGNPEKNTGDMTTKGFELTLGWKDNIGDFFYDVSFNLSDFTSKMGDLGGTEFLGDQVKLKGSEFNEWYGYVSEGLFLSQEDLDYSPKLNNQTKLGDIKYKDISGPNGVPDGKITPEYDRVLLGGSLPRYTYGGTINLGYKGLDLSLAFQGVGLQKSRMTNMMVKPLIANYGNIPAIIDGKYWSSFKTDSENAHAKYPRLTNANENGVYCMSDYWLFNGAYFRLKNLMLGYTLPERLTKSVYMKKLRFYATATDLFSISKYPKGWDPEVGPTSYPITTTVLLGAEITF